MPIPPPSQYPLLLTILATDKPNKFETDQANFRLQFIAEDAKLKAANKPERFTQIIDELDPANKEASTPETVTVIAGLLFTLAMETGTQTDPENVVSFDVGNLSKRDKEMLKAAKTSDIFATIVSGTPGTFDSALTSVVHDTIENALRDILEKGAKEAIRKASLDLLRSTFVSVAMGATPEVIKKAMTQAAADGGGQDDPGQAEVP